jgi:hypothetical protein
MNDRKTEQTRVMSLSARGPGSQRRITRAKRNPVVSNAARCLIAALIVAAPLFSSGNCSAASITAPVPPGVPAFIKSPQPDATLSAHQLTEGIAPVDNPLKGILYWWWNNDAPDGHPSPTSLEWHYFGLGDLMTDVNSFDWQPMEHYLDQVASHGRQACLRISTNISFGGIDIPTFLKDLPTTDGNLPYDNPRVVTAFVNFINAFGQKYDGDPRIGFITMGLVGKWGEWHTWPYEGGSNGLPNLMPSNATCETVINAYNVAFKITPIEIRYPRVAGGTLLATLAGIGFHDDSFCYKEADPNLNNQILSMTLPLSMGGKTDALETLALQYGVENRWMTASIGGEVRPEIQGQFVDSANQTKDDPVTDIEVLHATWMMCNQASWDSSNTKAMNVLRKFGYNFVVRTSYFNSQVGSSMKVGVRIENTGVAPFYYGPERWPVILGLKNGADSVVTTWTTNWDLRKVKPSKIRALPEWKVPNNPQYIDLSEPYYFDTTVSVANLAAGSYHLVMRVKNPLENITKQDLADNLDFSWQVYKQPKKFFFANAEQNADGWLALGDVSTNATGVGDAARSPASTYAIEIARNGSTGISVRFNVPQPSRVAFEIVNAQGKCLRREISDVRVSGVQRMNITTDNFSNGIYLLTVKAGGLCVRKTINIMK